MKRFVTSFISTQAAADENKADHGYEGPELHSFRFILDTAVHDLSAQEEMTRRWISLVPS